MYGLWTPVLLIPSSQKYVTNQPEIIDFSCPHRDAYHSAIPVAHFYLFSSLPIDINIYGFPGGSMVEYLPANAEEAGDVDLIPGSGRSPGGGNGNPPQYSCLGDPMDRGAWQATMHRVAKESNTTER